MITVINAYEDRPMHTRFMSEMVWNDGPLTSRRWKMILDQALDDLAALPESTALNVHIYIGADRIIRMTAYSFAYKDCAGAPRYNGFILENTRHAIVRNFGALPTYH